MLGIGIASLIAGCAAPPQPELDNSTPARWTQAPAEPTNEQASAQTITPEELQRWWLRLGDPDLNALVDEALARNGSLGEAIDTLQAQRILLGAAETPFQPQFSAGINTLQDIAALDSYFHASIDMSWDLGLFGAKQSHQLASYAQLLDAQAQLHQVRVELIALVVQRYLDIRVAQQQQAVLDKRMALQQRLVALSQVRLQQRLDSSASLHQAQLELAQVQAERITLHERQALAAHALAALLGRTTPEQRWLESDADARLPSTQAWQLQVLPADMLRTRAAIQLAQAQVMQAAGQLGLSRAALYPRFALGGSLLYAYNMTQNLRTSSDNMPTVGPVIDIPIFDWGRRTAQVDAHEVALEAAVKAYRQSVLDGLAEVEMALASLAAQTKRLESLVVTHDLLDERHQRMQRRRQLGLASEYTLLQEQRASLENTGEQGIAQAAQALAYVAVFKALGGAPLPEQAVAMDSRAAQSVPSNGAQRPQP